MRKQLLSIAALCAAGLVLGAQGQTSPGQTYPGNSSGSSSGAPGASGSSGYGGQSGWTSGRHGMGGMGQQETRASQLTGAQVTSTSGETLGTINDVIVNPASGKLDFAVLSLNSSSSSSSTGTSPSPSASSTSASSTGEKLVAVPWMLLRPSPAAGSSSSATSATSSTGQQISFVFAGDKSKLDAAPSFSQANWPDISQPSWRHSIFSYFGMTPGATATGGAEIPGGTSSGSEQSPSSSSSIPSSSSSGSSSTSSNSPSSSGNP